MEKFPLDLDSIRLDHEGRVVLDEAMLEVVEGHYVSAGGVSNSECHGHNGPCTNSRCGDSTNSNCTNSGGCNGTSNYRCDNLNDTIE